jgi:translation initiation factor IF-3
MKKTIPSGISYSSNQERVNKDASQSPINEQIRFPRLQVINYDGKNVGIITRIEALRLAQEAGLDLVLLADQGAEGVPVAKVMDFGKALYAKKKKQAESRKHQREIQIKEIKIRPKIGEHDYQTKINQAIDFLKDGKRLKVTLMFKGREMVLQQERGMALFDKIDKSFEAAELKHVVREKDTKMGALWSRMYYLKK